MLTLPLNSPRLVLRDFCAADLAPYQALRADADAPHYDPTAQSGAAFSAELLQRFLAQQQQQPRRSWQLAITLAADGRLIGSVGVRQGAVAGEASFGIELAATQQRQGYAQEAARLLLDAACNQLGLHRIEADTHAANLPAQRLAARLGFVPSHRHGERQSLVLGLSMLGAHTERQLLGRHARLQRHADCWQLATPSQPDFYFGNALLLDEPPQQRAAWEARFAQAFADVPGVHHRTLIWPQQHDDSAARYAEWTAAGYAYYESHALLLTRDTLQPAPLPDGYQLRPLHGAADWQQWQALMLATRDPGHDEAGYRQFLAGSMARYQALAADGHGHSWGVFAAGELLACAGLYTWQTLGRYQQVATAAHARRRGLASGLISALAEWGLARVPRLVIVADAHYHAIALYRKLGFVNASREAALCWWPRDTETAP